MGTFVPFSTIGAGNNETILCEGAFGPSAGDEVVLTANFAENQLVTVSTATDLTGDLDTYLYVREEFCTVASVEVTCNDDIDADTFQSEVTFVALAGIDYYIYVDGYAGANGAGEALFITQPVVFEGEDCSASACEPGTFCRPTTSACLRRMSAVPATTSSPAWTASSAPAKGSARSRPSRRRVRRVRRLCRWLRVRREPLRGGRDLLHGA